MAYSKVSRLLAILVVFFLFYSCQDNSDLLTLDALNPSVDEEMIEAVNLADTYLESIKYVNARTGTSDREVTNIKYHQRDLVYKTNDVTNGYHIIGEQTISAFVIPGEFIFWHVGGGLTDILGIEFDDYSTQFLESAPYRASQNLWAVRIKDLEDNEDDENDIHLKYDIIYKTKESGSTPIRLDPKIKLRQQQ